LFVLVYYCAAINSLRRCRHSLDFVFKRALRTYVYGPGKMQPNDAIERYKERRVRDAQAPIGRTDFDELDASDSDAEESDDDILGAGTGATYDPADMQGQ
jgi:hypothetical protein